MNTPSRDLSGILIFSALLLAGCAGGYVAGGGYDDGYYGPSGVWVDNTVVVGGGRGWYHGHDDHAYVHPSYHPAPHAQAHASAPHGSPGGRRP